MFNAFEYSMAIIIDSCGINGILVGDSLGMVIKGDEDTDEDTLGVTVEDIIYHTRAVKKGAKNALIVGDMPFLSYHVSIEDAVRNAGRIVKEGGAHAVKLEGGATVAKQVKAIVDVKKGAKNALIVGDMPFLSYHVSIEDAVRNAGRIVKEGGAHAVKLEGGATVAKQVKAIVDAQIPVMGHLGLTPQSVNAFYSSVCKRILLI